MKKLRFAFGLIVGFVTFLSSCNVNSPSETTTATPTTTTHVEYNYECATYSNPVSVSDKTGYDFTGEVADPSIVKGDDGCLYVFSTSQIVLKSEDGCNFEVIATNLFPKPSWHSELYPDVSSASFGVWAPDVVKIQDKWIYYYSLSGWDRPCGIGYAIADDIAGPYEDQGKLFDIKEIGIENCIDPQVFVEDDGKVYMTVGSFRGLYVVELTEDGMECLNGVDYQKENKVLVAGRPGPWDGSTYEGSYVIKENGYYYYFGSAGTCCEGKNSSYRVLVGRSESIKGPYVDAKGFALTGSGSGITRGNNVLWAGTDNDRPVYGPGHNSIFKDDKGDLWIYYHAYSAADNFRTRHLFMDKLSWDDNGYPYVSYVDPDTEKTVKFKPSYDIELDGPSFIVQ